jgi:hypothetical protein
MKKGLSLKPEQVNAFAFDEATDFDTLRSLGIAFDENAVSEIHNFYSRIGALDEAPATITTPSASNALQFLQYIFPAPIEIVTKARVADELLGRTFAGSWADEEVVMPVVERTGNARLYGDTANVPLASFNNNFEKRTIVRNELGLQVLKLEAERAARMRIDSAAIKRSAVAEALAIFMNDVAFNGFNGGDNRTYGILNDPNLEAYTTVATGANGDTSWIGKTFLEITADIRSALQTLRVQSGANFNPERDGFTLGIAVSSMEALAYTSDFGFSVEDFIKKNYPKCRIVAVPQFDEANGGENVFYVIADQIAGQKVADQIVQQELFLVGAMPTAKGMLEDYSSATAGAVVRMPIGVVRYSGI